MKIIQSVLSQKYQTVIPSAIRRTLGLQAGDTILWRIGQHGRSAKAIAEPAPKDWAAYTRGLGKDLIGTFQVGVAAMIADDEDNILIVKRSSQVAHSAGKWGVISGRLAQGESFEEALRREITEELGGEAVIEIVGPYFTFHHVRDDGYEVQGVSFSCRYKRGNIRLNDEHTEYRWVSVEKARQLITIESLRKELKRFEEKYLK